MDFRILEWISGFQNGFLDFRLDFWISQWISGFHSGFLDFTVDFWISAWISGFQFGFLQTVYEISFVTDPSGNPVTFPTLSLHGRLERGNNLGYLLLCSHTILRHCSMCQQLWCQSQRYYIVGLHGLHSPARLLLMPIRFVLCCYGNRCCSEPHPFCISKGVSAQLASSKLQAAGKI